MQQVLKKIRLLYIPYLIISISFLILYTFLHWALLIKYEIFSIKDYIINFGLPFGLSWIPVLIWLRPRINLLKLNGGNGNGPFLFFLFAAIAIAIPTIIAQNYIEKASGKLTKLTSISQINKVEKTKYYQVKKIYINKKNLGVYPHFEVGGKHNENFEMGLYVALPLFDNKSETDKTDCSAWLGVKYSKTISNKLTEEEKEKKFQDFTNESQKDFDNKNVNEFVYLERMTNSDDAEGFNEAIKENPKYNSIDAPALVAINEPFQSRAGDSFAWIFISFGITAVIWLIMILIAKFNSGKLQRFESGNKIPDRDFKELLELLKPQASHLVTQILIFSNILIFIIMVFCGFGFISFNGQDLMKWGANFRPSTINGEWWRLLTNIFLHGGIMHVVSNMFGLIIVGIFLEPLLGRAKYLLIYLLTGILASCASILWYDHTVSIGASGAIFGLYGVFLALLLTKVFPSEFSKAFLLSTLIYIGYNLLMGLTGGIDNAAHIGGLLAGFIIGLIIGPGLKRKTKTI